MLPCRRKTGLLYRGTLQCYIEGPCSFLWCTLWWTCQVLAASACAWSGARPLWHLNSSFTCAKCDWSVQSSVHFSGCNSDGTVSAFGPGFFSARLYSDSKCLCTVCLAWDQDVLQWDMWENTIDVKEHEPNQLCQRPFFRSRKTAPTTFPSSNDFLTFSRRTVCCFSGVFWSESKIVPGAILMLTQIWHELFCLDFLQHFR